MSDPTAIKNNDWRVRDFDYSVPQNAQRFGYSLGGVTLVGFMLLILSGILMSFFYIPDVDRARGSVMALSSFPVGQWLRSFHHWTAEAVTFLVILHISRIIFTGSYRGKRKLNWLFGVLLLVITMMFFFSGTVLKWDQEGYEAYGHAVEASELIPLIGGTLASVIVGVSALMRMFVTHAVVLPALLLLFVVPHLILMKLNGLSRLPNDTSERTVMFSQHLGRVLLFSVILYGAIAIIAGLLPTGLLPGPYTGVEMTKPPWVFLILYAFENWIGVSALLIVPAVVLVGLVAIPYVDRSSALNSVGRKIIVWGYIVGVALLVYLTIDVALSPPAAHLNM